MWVRHAIPTVRALTSSIRLYLVCNMEFFNFILICRDSYRSQSCSFELIRVASLSVKSKDTMIASINWEILRFSHGLQHVLIMAIRYL